MTTALDAVAAALAALYPDVPVRVRKLPAAGAEALKGGWTPGFPLPCFVVSGQDAEDVDEFGTFELVSVGYKVLVEYVKAAAAAVPSGGVPAEGAEDSDVRDKRAAVRGRLYTSPLGTLPPLIDLKNVPRVAYESAGGGKAWSSGQLFVFGVYEGRPASG